MDAFDADVLIYAAAPGHPERSRIRSLFQAAPVGADDRVGVGSVLLLTELLIKPERQRRTEEAPALEALLAQLDLHPVDADTARFAVALGATYGLRTVDAVHLATAALAGADRFITNNRRDFTKDIVEVDVTYPDEL